VSAATVRQARDAPVRARDGEEIVRMTPCRERRTEVLLSQTADVGIIHVIRRLLVTALHIIGSRHACQPERDNWPLFYR
jgi:hypothetical protein